MSATAKATVSHLGSFILAWLLSQDDSGTPNEITKAVQALFDDGESDAAKRRKAAVHEEVVALTQAGRVARVRRLAVALTDSGRRAALDALDWKKVPPKADWKVIKAQYQSVVMRLWFESRTDVPAAPQESTPSAHVTIATTAPVPPQDKPLAPKPQDKPPAPKPQDKPLIELPADDAAFAARVLAAARATKTGRFGKDKVFISHVLRQLTDEGVRVEDVENFKNRLVSVHRNELLSLSRADLVEAMDPKDVDASETRYRNATFHFIRV